VGASISTWRARSSNRARGRLSRDGQVLAAGRPARRLQWPAYDDRPRLASFGKGE
jgi:hypothetical protein